MKTHKSQALIINNINKSLLVNLIVYLCSNFIKPNKLL